MQLHVPTEQYVHIQTDNRVPETMLNVSGSVFLFRPHCTWTDRINEQDQEETKAWSVCGLFTRKKHALLLSVKVIDSTQQPRTKLETFQSEQLSLFPFPPNSPKTKQQLRNWRTKYSTPLSHYRITAKFGVIHINLRGREWMENKNGSSCPSTYLAKQAPIALLLLSCGWLSVVQWSYKMNTPSLL